MTPMLFPRATPPHMLSLAALLEPLVGPHFLAWDTPSTSVEITADWAGIPFPDAQALVDAAPDDSRELDAHFAFDSRPVADLARDLVLIDYINNATTGITLEEFVADVKAKIDTLS